MESAKPESPLQRNLRDEASRRGLSVRGLAIAAGLKPDAIRDVLRARSGSPRTSTLEAIASYTGRSIEDLVGSSSPAEQAEAPRRLAVERSIPEYDVRASAGDGAHPPAMRGNGSPPILAEWLIPADYIRSVCPNPEAVVVIRIIGDSMEPEYPSGERVPVDTAHTIPSPPGIYVVWDGFGLVLKRLEVVIGGPPRLRLSSVNPAYPPYECPLEEVAIQGRVLGRWVWK